MRATEQPGPRGFDGGKKTTGIKRHVCIDTLGLIWGLAVTTADIADSKWARLAVTLAEAARGRLVHVWADVAHQGLVEFAWVLLDVVVAIVTWRNGAEFDVRLRGLVAIK